MVTAPNLAAALVAAQKDMPKVEADAVNPHFKSRFTSLDHLIAKTRPVLTKHGLAIVQQPTGLTDEDKSGVVHPALATTILHTSGESMTSTMPLILAKADMQGLGAAITYARRYMWAALLGISEQEDDDGNQASAPARPAAQPAAAPAPATAPQLAEYRALAEAWGLIHPDFDVPAALALADGKASDWVERATAKLKTNIEERAAKDAAPENKTAGFQIPQSPADRKKAAA